MKIKIPLKPKFALKAFSLSLALLILVESFAPTLAMALTSGPSQPEITQFQPVGVNDMVDTFTGDFGYNIPLVELPGPNGGYPFNLSYQSGITMDQEASWVGLGWNVNAGAIVRNMRGLPDEFNGSDMVTREVDMLPNETYGGGMAVNLEFTGADFDKLKSANMEAGLSIGFKIYENSYKGIGYGIDLGTSFSKGAKGSNTHAGIGLNFSLDSQDGVGANVDLSVSSKEKLANGSKKTNREIGLGIGFHSAGGLNASIKGSTKTKKQTKSLSRTGNRGSSISFAVPSHTPTIGMEMQSKHFTGNLSMGATTNGVFPYFSANGFYSISKIDKKVELLPAYGYMHLQDKNSERAMSDFNREKDGMVYGTSSNLATPILTYDYYNINGQGIGGMFRPYRQDFGHIHEQERKSYGVGGSLGFDVGIPTSGLGGHFGISGSFNYSESHSGDWHNNNPALDYFKFRGKGYQDHVNNDDRYEGVYFKMVGEGAALPTTELDKIGGKKAVKIVQEGHSTKKWLGGDQFYQELNNDMMRRKERFPRSTAIIPYTNQQIMSVTGAFNEVLREYDIKILKRVISTAPITQDNLTSVDYSQQTNARKNKNHLAGITVTNSDGKRYVYALPAYNNNQIQESFSVPALSTPSPTINYNTAGTTPQYKYSGHLTEEYHERVTMPRYAHSYMLTSILGDDYVDTDGTPGPSSGDYGYWVKFNYVKASDNFPWRTPFSGATYYPGQAGSSMDDKAGYLYGTKEIWYLASAETKTHILVFEMSERLDGRGPGLEGMSTVSSPTLHGDRLWKLDKMKLYAKAEMQQKGAEPIQTVHFTYGYELCGNTPNSTAGNKAKLTLKSVAFTYKYDRSGLLSPYQFEYANDRNYGYNLTQNMYDRWGTYRSLNPGTAWANQEFPYTPQFNRGQAQTNANKNNFKHERDKNASAWHLTKITLPSGGKINVEYESDDYAFVQHKKAAQMFQVESIKNDPSGTENKHVLFEKTDNYWTASSSAADSREARRVYFKLEKPIAASLSADERKDIIIDSYLECLLDKAKNTYTLPLYAKLKVRLRGSIEEYISGYYKIELDGQGKPYCGTGNSTVTIDGVSSYDYGYVVLDFFTMKNKTIKYHPFAVSAWQHLRVNLPRVLTATGDFQSGQGSSDMEHLTRMGSLASWVNTISTMFNGYRKYCFMNEFAKYIDISESFVRLDSPDGFKFGGGSRVKKIYVKDDPIWSADEIGQVYEYTTDNGKGVVSSGVASYEPSVGGEETPMRTAKFYDQHLPFHTDNNLFFEYPINESHYPAPRVGYSKVTVSSLTTWNVQNKIANGDPANTYEGIQTTGKTVHEFYTSKEFPTITRETVVSPSGANMGMKYNPYVIPLPFVGMLSFSQLTATQGYAIILNDMHGKPKSVTTYASKKEGGFENSPLTRVIYEYSVTPSVYEGVPIYELDNEVEVLEDDPQMIGKVTSGSGNQNAKYSKMMIGTEYDFFADFRESLSEAGTGGLSFNIDIMGAGVIAIPLPFPWPSINYSNERTRLAVVNKVINQTGILKSTTATDGQSTVRTDNLVFDKYSGAPLLISVNNNYDDPIYNYEYPAYMAYSGTSAAYENILMEFSGQIINSPSKNNKQTWSIVPGSATDFTIGNQPGIGTLLSSLPTALNRITMAEMYAYLEEGDEFIVETYSSTGAAENKRFAVLFEKRMGVSYQECNNEPVLRFTFPYNIISPNAFWRPVKARFLLVRSGKRNLLDTKTGNIKALSNGIGNDAISQSPLVGRVKETGSLQTDPAIFEKLTRELVDFSKRILDCDGKLPVGQYYMDDARFINGEGEPMFKNLLGLLESIRVDDVCGGTQPCLQTESSMVWQKGGYYVRCRTGCTTVIKPATDPYDTPQYGCLMPLPSQTAVNDFVAQYPDQSPSTIVSAWNSSLSNFCSELYYVAPGYVIQTSCTDGPCLSCNSILGVDPDGHNIREGYHIVLKFRPPFKSPDNTDCYTSHCLAKARYKHNGVIFDTKITDVQYLSPGKIRFFYTGNGSPSSTDFCMKTMTFSSTPSYYKIKNVLAASSAELSPYKIDENVFGACDASFSIRNLYTNGYKGIWRPSKTFYYEDERYQGNKPNQQAHMTSMLNTQTDGIYDGTDNDKYFYLFNWNSDIFRKTHERWLANETVTGYNRNSMSAEARDVLGIYSSVLFDTDQKMPVAVGRSMRKNQAFYENFDNTQNLVFNASPAIAALPNSGSSLAMNDPGRISIVGGVSFTGNKCLSTIYPAQCNIPKTIFKPDAGRYIISMWVGGYNTVYSPERVDALFPNIMNVQLYFLDAQGQPLTIPGTGLTHLNFRPKGKIMEGKGTFWRKLEETFTVPPGTESVRIGFGTTNLAYGSQHIALSLTGNVFLDRRACYDDIRIHPADGMMKSYVYDVNDHKMLAEIDENNYPTLYGYSASGALMTVKKLTEEGIKTLKEIRSNTKRTLPPNVIGPQYPTYNE